MKLSSYGLVGLVILVTSSPALALADSDDDQSTYQVQGQQSSTAPTQTPSQADQNVNNAAHAAFSTFSSLVLYGTISAIIVVIGYSGWKVYNVRRKIVSKNLV